MEAVDEVVLVVGRGVNGDQAEVAENQLGALRVRDRRVISALGKLLPSIASQFPAEWAKSRRINIHRGGR